MILPVFWLTDPRMGVEAGHRVLGTQHPMPQRARAKKGHHNKAFLWPLWISFASIHLLNSNAAESLDYFR